MRRLTFLALALGLSLSAVAAQAQSKLQPCPNPDYSKTTDKERHAKWTNCWGGYKVELDARYKDDVLEGEWLNGSLHGQGTSYFLATNQFKGDKYVGEFKDSKRDGLVTHYYLANNQFKGDKYVGAWKENKKHGQGTYTHADGDKYVGEYKDDKRNGQGTYTFANGGVGAHDKNPATGKYVEAVVSRKPRAWYWTANDGKVYINLRYGTKILELSKGKSAIEVGEMKQLVPVIEALKQAVAAGELDVQIDAAGNEVGKNFSKPVI